MSMHLAVNRSKSMRVKEMSGKTNQYWRPDVGELRHGPSAVREGPKQIIGDTTGRLGPSLPRGDKRGQMGFGLRISYSYTKFYLYLYHGGLTGTARLWSKSSRGLDLLGFAISLQVNFRHGVSFISNSEA